ncbi:MAG: copper resistance protein CopC [Sphingomonadales bacterium]|nr:MAG: copper resistance protein CopC [Sphingomonadales bacterium]
MFTRFIALAPLAMLVAPMPAMAHPKLLSITPTDKAVASKPVQVSLAFSEVLMAPLSGVEVVMTGMPGMADHPPMKMTAAVKVSGKTMVASFAHPLAPGSYTVKWHVVSADTHRIEGNTSFTVK